VNSSPPLSGAAVYADVIVARPARGLDRPFTYRVPPALQPHVVAGAVVEVPFRGGSLVGYVIDLHADAPSSLAEDAIRDVLQVRSPREFWGEDLLGAAGWMQYYYGCLMVEALNAIIPEPVRAGLWRKRPARGAPARTRVVALTDNGPDPEPLLRALDGDGPQARRVLDALRRHGHLPASELLNLAHARTETIHHLRDAGLVKYRMVAPDQLSAWHDPLKGTSALGSTERPDLTPAQREAVDRILALRAQGKAAAVLLHGVTGSGKTEVYLRVLEAVTEAGGTAVVLVPEISLTPQAVHRYRTRLGEKVAVLHSGLTDAERHEQWWSLRRGGMAVALGARSCVFAPFDRPSVLVVDEEHDSSYKQDSSPRYHARQVAIRRALQGNGVVVLGSATPSLESYHWAREGRYHLLELGERVEGRPLPEVEIVDLRRFGRGRPVALGAVLRERMREALAAGGQVMLLMNRRGFSSYLMCTDCGHMERCPRCDISLTVHAAPECLRCHYCLFEKGHMAVCPGCTGVSLKYFGSGTQRVEEELLGAFPGISLARMDADTTRRPGDHLRLLEKFGRGEIQVLLGTQMIAKGHDFPGVTLVGVVLADTALNLPDFRAAERTFSLLVQVSGRAGRGARPGRVVVQTYNPDNPAVLLAARQDYKAFFDLELGHRRELSYPPFVHLVNVVFASEDEAAAQAAAHSLAAGILPEARALGAGWLGPAPCAIPRLHRKYRWHLTFKANKVQEIVPLIRKFLAAGIPAGVAVTIDADPMSML